jgi:hypothetical protein
MTITVKISRSGEQWIADVPKAPGLVVWSTSLARLRKHVATGIKQFYPDLAKAELREVIELPPKERALLRSIVKAERKAEEARRHAMALKRRVSQRLRSRLGISIREVGVLLGVSGARAQQLLGEGSKDLIGSLKRRIRVRGNIESTG